MRLFGECHRENHGVSLSRRVRGSVFAIVGATTIALTQAPVPGSKPQAPAAPSAESVKKAEQALADARKALGGDKLSELKTLVASGRTKRVRGNNLVPIEFEILIEPPAKYVRVDEFPAEDTDPRRLDSTGTPDSDSAATGHAGGAGSRTSRHRSGRAPGAAPSGCWGACRRRAGGSDCPSARDYHTSGRCDTSRGCENFLQVRHFSGQVRHLRQDATPSDRHDASRRCGAAGGSHASSWRNAPGMMPPGGMPRGGRGPGMDPWRARLNTVKQDYARLALGLFAASSAYPLTYSYAAVAEAPQGRADVLDVKGEGNFALRYFIHSETRLPIMVTWTTPPTNVIATVPGEPPPATVAPGAVVVPGPPAPAKDAPKEEMDKYSKEVLAIRAKAQATPVEHRLYFADDRDAGRAQAALQAPPRHRDRDDRGKRHSIGFASTRRLTSGSSSR